MSSPPFPGSWIGATSPVSKCKGSALWLSIATSGKPLLPPPVRLGSPRSVLVSAPLAVVATLSAVTMGVLAAEPATSDNLLASSGSSQPAAGSSGDTVDDSALRRRSETTTVSRSQIRTAAKAEAAARTKIAAAREDRSVNRKARQLAEKVDDAVWTTDVLNLWDGPSEAPTSWASSAPSSRCP